MGLFNLKKNIDKTSKKGPSRSEIMEEKKNRLKKVLSGLDINPYDFKHEDMLESEISLAEEVIGAVRVSDLTFETKDGEWDFVSLTEYRDGKKSLYLSKNNREERAIKVLVDRLFEIFGESLYASGEFSKYDYMTMQEEKKGELREWHLTFFKVVVGFNISEKMRSYYVLVDEK